MLRGEAALNEMRRLEADAKLAEVLMESGQRDTAQDTSIVQTRRLRGVHEHWETHTIGAACDAEVMWACLARELHGEDSARSAAEEHRNHLPKQFAQFQSDLAETSDRLRDERVARRVAARELEASRWRLGSCNPESWAELEVDAVKLHESEAAGGRQRMELEQESRPLCGRAHVRT